LGLRRPFAWHGALGNALRRVPGIAGAFGTARRPFPTG